jgi:hypothetical protein
MFETTSYNYFSDAAYAGGGDPLWFQKNFPSKEAWKAAGSPGAETPGQTPGPFNPPAGLPGGSSGVGPVSGPPSSVGPQAAPSSGGLLGGIPTKYLLIGGVIIALMMFKK